MDVDLLSILLKDAPEHFKSGKIVETLAEPELSRIAYETTKNIYLAFLFMIFPKNKHLKELLDKGINFLDIGCGDGTLIVQFANAFGKSKFVGINPDNHGIGVAKATISKMGLEERVTVENIGGEKIPFE